MKAPNHATAQVGGHTAACVKDAEGRMFIRFSTVAEPDVYRDTPVSSRTEAEARIAAWVNARTRHPQRRPLWLMDEADIQPRRPAVAWSERPVSDLDVGPAMVIKLRDHGFLTFADVDAASDADLVAVPGLGPKTVAAIREAIAAWKWRPGA